MPGSSTTQQDWRDAARGIPVWDFAMVVVGEQNRPWRTDRVDYATDTEVAFVHGAPCHPRDTFPDLSDPDTRAGFDRRLALALGAPPEAVDEGASLVRKVRPVGGHDEHIGWILAAGPIYDRTEPGHFWRWSVPIKADTTDPLLARALAWPADKRVAG